MVKVPPTSWSGVSLRARARVVRSRASRAVSVRVLRPASRMTGTMSPSSMATATPMLTWRCRRIRVSSHEALRWRRAAALAGGSLDVGADDPPAGAAALEAREIDVLRLGELAGQR